MVVLKRKHRTELPSVRDVIIVHGCIETNNNDTNYGVIICDNRTWLY